MLNRTSNLALITRRVPAAVLLVAAICVALGTWGCSRSAPAGHKTGSVGSSAASGEEREPPRVEASPEEAAETMRAVLSAQGPLLLSTHESAGSKRFHFQSWIGWRTEQMDSTLSMLVFLSTDESKVGMLLCSTAGLPYCYVSEGRLLAVDRQRRGGLVSYRGGAPAFVLKIDPDTGHLDLKVEFRLDQPKPYVHVDLPGLLERALDQMQAGTVDRSNHFVLVRTPNSAISIGLRMPDGENKFPIRSFVMRSNSQGTGVGVMNLAERQPPGFDLLSVDDQEVLRLAVPMRVLTREEAAQVRLSVPGDFGRDPREENAAKSLLQLFVGNQRPGLDGLEVRLGTDGGSGKVLSGSGAWTEASTLQRESTRCLASWRAQLKQSTPPRVAGTD